MPNAVNSAEYQACLKETEILFEKSNFTERQTINLNGEYKIIKDAYKIKTDKCSLSGGEYWLFDAQKSQIKNWRCIDDRAEFFSLIRHANGKIYLIFRQDLYGYSVLDLDAKRLMRFLPSAYLEGKESFIWTDARYLADWDALAVGKCYWAAPRDIHLIGFSEPMSEYQKYIDVLDFLDGGYDIYDEADFAGFSGGELNLICMRSDAPKYENIKISRTDYLKWMSEAKYL